MGPGPFDPSEFSGAPELVLFLLGVLGVCALLGAVYAAVDAVRKRR